MNDPAFNVSSAWIGAGGEYLEAVRKLINVDDVNTIVEVGVDWGYSLFTLARDFPNAFVFGVDDYAHHHDASQAHAHVIAHLSTFKNVRLLHKESSQAYREWREPAMYLDIDILHIDGDHSIEGVTRDYEMWSKAVIPGGLIMFHDINSHKNTVGKFFDSLVGKKEIVDVNGSGLGIYVKDED